MSSQAGDATPYGDSGDHVLLRRYSVTPGRWPEFLEIMRRIARVRQRHGFEIVCAFADREENMFTWAIAYSGDIDTAARDYYADPERVALQVINDLVVEYQIRPVEAVELLQVTP